MTPNEQITELRVAVAEIKGAVSNLSATISDARGLDKEFDTRLRSLEAWRWKLVGVAAGAGAFVSWMVQVIGVHH